MGVRVTRQVSESFRAFEPCGEAFIARALLRLSEENPTTRAVLPSGSEEFHATAFAHLRHIVRNVSKFGSLESGLTKLGKRADAAGITPNDLQHARRALIVTMSELLHEEWNDDLHAAWEHTLQAACGAMLRGMTPTRRAA